VGDVEKIFFFNFWKKDAGTSSILLNMFQDDRHLKIFCEFCYSTELTLFRKGVTLQNFKWRVTLQNFTSPVKKWKVDRKNVIHSKSKQLHFKVAWNECDLKWM